jgi:hypothetical protein
MTNDDGHLVSFGTAFHGTRIHRRAAAYEWVRHPGPLRLEPFTPVHPDLRTTLEALDTDGVRLGVGVADGPERRYRAGSPSTASNVLQPGPADEVWPALQPLLHATGRALLLLHTGVAAPADAPAPAGATRLASWLRTGHGPQHAPRLFALARQMLGAERWERASDWAADATGARPGAVFLHGGASLGALVLDATPDGLLTGTGTLLTGEDLARGPAAYDVGWLLGELAEFRLLPQGRQHPQTAHRLREAARHILRGYGPVCPVAVGRVATLRILTHAHDFAAYVGWHDQLPEYVGLVADLLDSDGAAALPDTPLKEAGALT